MTNIEQPLASMEGNAKGALSASSSQQKQAWLRTLEKTGLSDALSKTRIFSMPDKKPTAFEIAPLKAGVDTKSESGDSETHLSTAATAPVSGRYYPEAINRQVLLSSGPSEEVQGLMGFGQQTHDMARLNNQILNLPSKSISFASLAWDTLQYPLRNMVMVRSDSEVEIWVRDAAMSKARLMEILAGIRQSVGMLGVSLARVVLNGQDVLSSHESGESSSHLKEV